MTVDPTQIELSPDQRMRLAMLAESVGKKWSEVVDNLLDTAPAALLRPPVAAPNGNASQGRTLFDVLSERGILGCFDGPTDLSTNPKHMEGFGESRHPKSPD